MKYAVLLLLIISYSFIANAQNNKGKITGKVIDAGDKTAVDYATVSLFKQGSIAAFNGASTDDKGNFVIDHVPAGDYKLNIDFIGYQRKTIDHVIVSNGTVSLGTIALASAQKQLQTVNIQAKAPTVENKIDKMVYNPANDLTSQGGVALDVLKKVPQVSVDINGNVELQGNSNIRFLINGKPSSVFGASLTDALQAIPASQIKNIEVITSPGAKYDAEGTGGIINIVLKNNNVQGINGSVNLSAGTRFENGSFNLNAKKGNFGVNAFFSGNDQLNTATLSRTNRTSTDTLGNKTMLAQDGSSNFKRSGYQSGISFDWNITKKDELTGSFGFNHFGNNGYGPTNQSETIMGDTLSRTIRSLRQTNSSFSANSSDVSLSYKRTFNKKDQELDVLYVSTFGNNTNKADQMQQYFDGTTPATGLTSYNPGKDHETDISIDYTQPFTKSFTLETGAKTVIEDISNNITTDTLLQNGNYVENSNQTYGFNYNRKIFAYYLSGTFSLFNNFINGKLGGRYEYTTTSVDFPNTHIPDYGILVPSFVLQHKLSETESLRFSYTLRLERPNYGDLNPFYNIGDPHNISTGNPNLRPEKGHNFELGYNKSFNDGVNIYFAGFYRHNTDDIQSFVTYYPVLDVNGTSYTDVSLNQRYNIGTESTTGSNIYIEVPLTGKFNLRSNMMFGNRVTTNPGYPETSGFMYRLNLNASYDFGNNFVAEVFGNYRSSMRTIQGTQPGFGFYNIAMRKQFWNKKASIGISVANPFNKYVSQTGTTSGSNFTQTFERQIPLQSFGINLSYRFGKLEFKKDKNSEDENPPMPADNQNQ
ncbi:MAG: TonB-dependent receptor domain-containing protein [Mucilaginibacter sp.]